MAIGYLTIQARTAHDAIPLAGVRIGILDDEGRSVFELTTDENGEAPLVSLETVGRELSLDPYYGGMAYIGYDVFAQTAGFHSIHVTGIPIYEGETAVLPLMFVPLSEGQRGAGTTEIVIGKPAASMREARYQEAPVDEPRVLRQVIIPNPITVHLGRPAAYASNVQVSFPDYVKNVASSEIYPTWPEASLRANIYAIITFALNRVFTEWYRSQGYSFDITNSTAYDQAFVYGRPIYESISRVVDDIFNEYVRRQGQFAPYFTSFCNGTTTTCSGLSQWGTVTLANQGLTPLQILRTYYPDDVEIATTDIIANVPSSYPGSPLRVGSTGLDVQTIQTYLNRIRRNYPAIPTITDEVGVFGDSTRAAVTKFQSVFQLAADGIVGKATWYKISQLYTAVTRLSELDSEGTTLGIGTVPPATVLRQGSRGADVITLQYLLDVIAEYYPSIPSVSQDGIFGNGTRQAVIAFQQTKGLTPDGIVGTQTWRALYDAYHGIGDYVPTPEPDTGTMEYVVRAGDTLWLLSQRYGTTVAELKRLNNLTGDELNIGQVLKIPTGQTPSYFEYTVRAGDTLWLLSQRYGTTVDAIKSLNGLTGNLLNIGQVLLIPR
ncbi:MAG: LysM peptidoglycan-binding domain-containing protein [Lachnospiraceae bacterium]|nr:LysM peptidoglycan-binding domain-containing protein [Lachnospiraceae bacterium]